MGALTGCSVGVLADDSVTMLTVCSVLVSDGCSLLVSGTGSSAEMLDSDTDRGARMLVVGAGPVPTSCPDWRYAAVSMYP